MTTDDIESACFVCGSPDHDECDPVCIVCEDVCNASCTRCDDPICTECCRWRHGNVYCSECADEVDIDAQEFLDSLRKGGLDGF